MGIERNGSDPDRRARGPAELAQSGGRDVDRGDLARKANALRRSAHALGDGLGVRLGQPIIRDPTSRIWWVIGLRAFATMAFGVLAFVWPRHSAQALLGLFGAYAIFDGLVLFLVTANVGRRRMWLSLRATINVVFGLAALTHPATVALLLVRVLGAWLLLHGLAEILCEPATRSSDPAAQPRARQDLGVLLNGSMSALFGIGLIAAPKIGALSLLWAVGTWAVLHGLLMLPLAFRLRRETSSGVAS